MKKSLAILAAAAIMLSMAGCGKKDSNTSDTTAQSSAAESSANPSGTVSGMESGKLYFIGEGNGAQQVLNGIQISGNRAGDEINKKAPATEGIRCIFELNEWVEFYPDTAMTDGIEVWVFEHKDDLGAYENGKISMDMKGFVISLSLIKEEDAASAWGSFCLNPDSVQPGLYDFVFTYNGTAFASMVTRFYGENELSGKSDAELENMMKSLK